MGPATAGNMGRLLTNIARRLPDHAAIIRGAQRITWSQLDARVDRLCAVLRAQGVAPGDRVLVHMRNGPAIIETLFACFKTGAVWVPTNVRLTPPEVAYLASHSRVVAMIRDQGMAAHAEAARAATQALTNVIALGDASGTEIDYETALDSATPPPPDHEADVTYDHPCWFFFTSGTTGRPKAGVLTHGQMAFVTTNHAADLMPGTTEADRSLVVAPLSHGAGIHLLVQVARGAASVLPESEALDPEEAWRLVEAHRVTNMFTVPTILTRLVAHPSVDRFDHSSLRYVIYAGAPMYRADQKRAIAALGPVLVQYFGLGEVTGNITVLPPSMHTLNDADPSVGSCGYPRTGMEVGILAPSGTRMAAGETGEICVRGPAVMSGYFENDKANETAFAHGWFHTGDLGHLDARGLLFITGRASDMFISGGSNVYPREIEELLLTHPDVAEAAVVGLPHPEWGEAGVAALVPRDGALDVASVVSFLEGRLARYKHPKRIVVWDALPKSAYGKVPKSLVRDRLASEGVAFGEPLDPG